MTDPQGPPLHGQPYPYGYPPARPTSSMAIVALITAFLVPPAGVVLGVVARRQIRRTGQNGGGLALAGIIVGAALTVLFLLMFAVPLIIIDMTDAVSPTPSPTPG